MGFIPTNPDRRLFISWVKYTTRSASFAKAIGAEAHFLNQAEGWGPLKYVPRKIAMLWLLLTRRPKVVLCMNPPYFVGALAWFYCLFFDARFTLDSHSAAFDSRKWTWMMPLHSFLVKRAAASTVTNPELARRVEAMGGTAVVLSDIPYTMPAGDYPVAADKFTLCFVCNYAEDEPIFEVFDAARALPDVHIYVTGNEKKATDEMRAVKPDNATLTGYLSNEEYAGLLRQVDALLVLTTRDHTMQRGGSEAVTVGKPLITSDWPILREIFSAGTVHVDNTADGIRRGIEAVQANPQQYAQEILQLRERREARWAEVRAKLEALLV
jgi:glycosyltransferase involved in cell wall biosynthesis